MTRDLTTRADAKRQAKDMRDQLASQGTKITHSEALEAIAHRQGFRDWNALSATLWDGLPDTWSKGGRVTGTYLSQRFAATVLSSEPLRPGWVRLVLDLDEAVDVVRFESFSNFRKQIRSVVGPEGHSKERTSDGVPHLVLEG